MIRISINLPTKHRLDLHLVKRRTSAYHKPLLPAFEDIKRVKKGSRLSRVFRHIFEYKNIKRLLGVNLAAFVITTSFVPSAVSKLDSASEEVVVSEKAVHLTTEKSTQYPVKKIVLSQGVKFYHVALDLDGLTGDLIYPIKPGVVEYASYSRLGYGKVVIIDHGEGISSLYAHLSKIYVKKGQKIDLSTPIGEMGATGRASGDHLHLEVRENGFPINPYKVLPRL